MLEKIAVALTLLLIPVGIAVVVLHARVLRHMRLRHAKVWDALGRPRIVRARTVSETVNTLRYLWRRDYRGLKDRPFMVLCAWLRSLHLVYAGLILLAMGFFAAHIHSLNPG